MADLRKIKDRAAEMAAKGKLEKAADLFREAIRADGKDVATRQKLAEVLRRAGKIPEAIEAYREVADRFARDGLLIKAIAISKTILELEPDHVETQSALAELYARRAATEGARPPARTVVLSALRAAAPPAAPPVRPVALVPPPPAEPEERLVELPLAAPDPEPVPIESLLEPTPVAPPPGPAESTPFARIAFAASAAIAAGVEEEIVIEAEILDEEALAVGEDEPLGAPRAAAPAPRPPPPARPLPAPPAAPAPGPASRPPSAPPSARPAAPPAPPPGDGRLPRVPIFSDLSREAFVELTRAMTLRRVNEGEVVIREAETDTAFYVVSSGKLAVSKRNERGDAVVLARLADGDFFGEMALLSGAPRAATVIAEEPCELLEFRAEVLLDLAGRHPHVAGSIRRFYRQRLLANALAVSPIFRPFARGDRKLVMERFRTRDVIEGEVVVREGEPSDGLYVILEGAVDVLKRRSGSDVLVGHLKEGDLFGEMSCLRKAPASATVAVRRPGTLLRLPRKDFDDLVVSYPQILELVSELSEERAENLDAILSGHAQWTEEGLVLV